MPSSHRSSTNRRRILYAITTVLVLYLIIAETLLHESHPISNSHLAHHDEDTIGSEIGAGKTPTILLVSALFPLTKSKHSHSEYEDWLVRFLGSISTPVYFYAPPSLASMVLTARGNHTIYLNTTYTSPFDIPPFKDLRPVYDHQHIIDREAFRHSPELYAVWNSKPWLVDNAIQNLRETRGEVYDYVFWNDAGSFRHEHTYAQWPSPQRIEEVWNEGAFRSGKTKEELLFFPFRGTYSWLNRYWHEIDGPIDSEISEGSFFGGSPTIMSWWSKTYYAYHDHYLQKGLFVGKDQTLINALFLLFPSRIIGVWNGDSATRSGIPHFDSGPLGECGDPWFYYQFFLASGNEREYMTERWMGNLVSKVWWPWRNWRWWLQRQQCKMTRVVWMSDMLQSALGRGWHAVRSTISD